MEREKSNLKGLFGKLAVGATLALGVTDLSSCSPYVVDRWHRQDNTTYICYGDVHMKTMNGERQSDGSMVQNFSRDPIIQNNFRKSIQKLYPNAVARSADGTVLNLDVKCLIIFPDDSAVIKYYDK